MNLFELVAVLTLNKKGYDEGIASAEKSASSFGSKLKKGLGTAAKVGTAAMATLGAAAVGVTKKLMDVSSEVGQLGDHIDKQSQKIGISAKAYQEWDFIMTHCGASVDSLQTAMKIMSTQAQKGAEEFELLGISQKELAELGTEELFARVVEGLQNMEAGTERTALATKILGRGATELAPLLNQTSEATAEMKQQAHDLGKVMSDEAVKAGAAYQDSMYNLQTAIGGLKNKLGGQFLPSIVEVMDGLTALFTGDDSGADKVANGIEKIVEGIGKALPKIVSLLTKIAGALGEALVKAFPTIMQTITQALPELVNEIIPLIEGLAKALMDNIDPLLDAAIQIVTMLIDYLIENIDKIVTGLTDLMLKIVDKIPDIIVPLLEAIPGLITSIIDAISENLPRIVEGLMGVVVKIADKLPEIIVSLIDALPDLIDKLLTAVLDSLPAIIDGLVDVVLGIVDHIDEIIISLIKAIPKIISKLIKALLKAIPQLIKGAIKLVKGLVKAIPEIIKSLIEAIPDIIDSILEAFGDLGSGIKELFGGIFDAAGEILGPIGETISEIFDKIDLSEWFEGVKKFFTDIKDWAKARFDDIGKFFSDTWNGFTTALSKPLEEIKKFFENVKTKAKEILDWIGDKFSSVFTWIGDKVKSLLPDSWTGVGEATGTVAGTVIKPKMAKGGVLEKGQMGFLEGNGAEAVVPLENNYKWIHAVARDMGNALYTNGRSTVNHTGTITVKGVNNRGEFIGSADYVIDELLAGLRHDARLSYGYN